ncbi:MAG: hypothetical protein U1E77_03030 [Inhella sp.]
MNELTYNIQSGRLSGRVDGVAITASAGSGGRAGSKTAGALNYWLANNPFATHVKLNNKLGSSGGPLPLGTYALALHESRPNWIRLNPTGKHFDLHGRAGFAIHGRGPRGSDGCIVPTDFTVVLALCKLVKARADSGKPAIQLHVVAEGSDLERWLGMA